MLNFATRLLRTALGSWKLKYTTDSLTGCPYYLSQTVS